MNVYTSHVRPGDAPILVKEGFSLGAAIFGLFWLAWQRAWIPAALVLAADIVAGRLGSPSTRAAVGIAVLLVCGLFGRDFVRWSLLRRGYCPGPVVAAADSDAAFARLLAERADLIPARVA